MHGLKEISPLDLVRSCRHVPDAGFCCDGCVKAAMENARKVALWDAEKALSHAGAPDEYLTILRELAT